MENYIELIIKTMVEKFLSWKLPKDFYPDCGISFEHHYVLNEPIYKPVGTNLFTAEQAKAMFEYCAKEILEEIINDLDERNNTQAIYIDNHMARVAELEKENEELKSLLSDALDDVGEKLGEYKEIYKNYPSKQKRIEFQQDLYDGIMKILFTNTNKDTK